MNPIRRPLLGVLVASIALAGQARAQQGEAPASASKYTDDQLREASDVAGSLMSPFCPGRTLNACPSPRAGAWRAEIRDWIAQGVPREQIVARLQARSPQMDLASHQRSGYGWVAPAVAVVLVTLLIVVVGRRMLRGRAGPAADGEETAGAAEPAPVAEGELATYRELLDSELKKESS